MSYLEICSQHARNVDKEMKCVLRNSVVKLHARTGLMEMTSGSWVSLERGSTVL